MARKGSPVHNAVRGVGTVVLPPIAASMRIRLKNAYLGLTFEPVEHVYHVDGKKMTSVSKFISEFYEPFDPSIKFGYAKKHNLPVKFIESSWEGENRWVTEKGTDSHNFGEDYVNHKFFGVGTSKVPSNLQELGICMWWEDYLSKNPHIVPVYMELQMYNKRWGLAGTGDILLLNTKNGKIIIADYKTNKDLYDNFGGKTFIIKALPLLDQNLSKYEVQLSTYQILLEEAGFEVEDRIIIHLQKDEDSGKHYKQIHTPDHTKVIRGILDDVFCPAA